MKFTQEFIERVQESSNLIDIISQYTQLKPAAGGFMGRCPFPDHPEKTASFSASETKQVYNCFGCHKKGNIFTFLKEYNGMNFPDAVEYLAERAGIEVPKVESVDSQKQDLLQAKKKEIIKINKLAVQYFQDYLKKQSSKHHVQQYIKKRQLSNEVIEKFYVGYAGEEWDGLTNYFQSKGVSLPLAEEARLIKARKDGKSGYFDLFRDRLMFPIFNTMGDPIAFGGRVILQGEPKYLNSPETLVFIKGKTLYGLNETSKYIRSDDIALVVEGYMDLVALYQVDVKQVVATMGTAMTYDHGRMLSRITKNVVVLFDGDNAGQDAAERSLPILLGCDLHPKGLILPDNMDPDDFVKKFGGEELKNHIAQAPDLFSVILEMWMSDYRGEASQKVKLADRLQPIFAAIQDPRLKSLYFKEACQKLSVDENWMRSALQAQPKKEFGAARKLEFTEGKTPISQGTLKNDAKLENKNEITEPTSLTTSEPTQIKLKGASRAESMLVGLVLKNRANFETFLISGVTEQVNHSGVKELLMKAAFIHGHSPEKFDKLASLLTNQVDEPNMLFAFASEKETTNSGNDLDLEAEEMKLLQDCLKRVRIDTLRSRSKLVAAEIKAQPGDSGKLEQFMNIQKELQALQKTESNSELAVEGAGDISGNQ